MTRKGLKPKSFHQG